MRYFGITGFSTPAEVNDARHTYSGLPDQIAIPKMMIGILVNQRTLIGKSAKRPNRYPPVDQIRHLLIDDPVGLYNTIHWCPGHTNMVDHNLIDYVECLMRNQSGRLHAIQFNSCWPTGIDEASAILGESGLGLDLILQIGREAMLAVNFNPQRVVEKIRSYNQRISSVLLDPSGGRGLQLDPALLRPFIEAISYAFPAPWLEIGIAGGLCADNLDIIVPLLKDFPQLSIDAESRLRDGSGKLDTDKIDRYIERAGELYLSLE